MPNQVCQLLPQPFCTGSPPFCLQALLRHTIRWSALLHYHPGPPPCRCSKLRSSKSWRNHQASQPIPTPRLPSLIHLAHLLLLHRLPLTSLQKKRRKPRTWRRKSWNWKKRPLLHTRRCFQVQSATIFFLIHFLFKKFSVLSFPNSASF